MGALAGLLVVAARGGAGVLHKMLRAVSVICVIAP